MRHRLIVGTVVLLASALAPMSARGDTTHNVTVVSAIGLPSGWTFTSTNAYCLPQDQGDAPATMAHVSGPGRPPLGSGSLEISVPPGELAQLTFALPDDPDQDLTSIGMHGYRPAILNSSNMLSVTEDINIAFPDDPRTYDVRLPADETTQTWEASDAQSVWNWEYRGPDETNPAEDANSMGLGPYPDFIDSNGTTHPGTLLTFVVNFNNCAQPNAETYAIDDVTVGLSTGGGNGVTTPTVTTNTVTDFEPTPPTVLTPRLSPATTTVGAEVRPSVTASIKGVSAASLKLPLTLQAEPAGTSTYRTIATATTNSKGVARAPAQRVRKNTVYRWTYVAQPSRVYLASTSTPITAAVGPTVGLRLSKRRVSHHTPVVATGRATPKRRYAVVTLWGGKHPAPLAVGLEAKNGAFRITTKLPRGSYPVYVTVAPDASYATGRSSPVRVKVR